LVLELVDAVVGAIKVAEGEDIMVVEQEYK
jgi:hypothetical protein